MSAALFRRMSKSSRSTSSAPRRVYTRKVDASQKPLRLKVVVEFPIDVMPTDTIGEVMAKIQEKEGILFQRHNVVFDDRLLEDNRTLGHYNIANDSTIRIKRKQAKHSATAAEALPPPLDAATS